MTLAKTTKFFKQSVLIFIALIILYFVGKYTISAGATILAIMFPEQPPAPTVEFGALPYPKIESLKVNGDIEYNVDTISGRLPTNLPTIMPVYPVIKPRQNIFAESQARQTARRLGFDADRYTQLDTVNWQWMDVSPQRTLVLNILSYNYEITPNLSELNLILRRGEALTAEQAQSIAYNIASNQPFLNEPIKDRDFIVRTSYARISQGTLREATSRSEAVFTRVDLYQPIVIGNTTYAIYGTRYPDSYLQVFLTERFRGQNSIVKAKIHYWPFDRDRGSTYPLRSIRAAWENLEQGESTIVQVKPDGADRYDAYSLINIRSVDIKTVELAYLMEEQGPNFIQPIYVFNGRFTTPDNRTGDFTAYLPAVDPSLLE